jgi:peptidoglycan hydrolase-like protein with peptidoglycan-binding domain
MKFKRNLLLVIVVFVGLSMFQSVQASNWGSNTVGEKVLLNNTVNVRDNASVSANTIGTQVRGAIGTIVGGPVTANNFVWWKVNYASGVDGWSVENYMVPAGSDLSNPNNNLYFNAIPTTISPGQSSLLTYSPVNATSCAITLDQPGARPSVLQLGGTVNVSPQITTIYDFICSWPNGQGAKTVTVTVLVPVTLKVSSYVDDNHQTFTNAYIGGNAQNTSVWYWGLTISCQSGIVQFNNSGKNICGTTFTQNSFDLKDPTKDNLMLLGRVVNNSSVSANVALSLVAYDYHNNILGTDNKIIVIPAQMQTQQAPTVTVSANPTSITVGQTSTLSWSSTNAISCTGTGGDNAGWSGTTKPTSGTYTTPPMPGNLGSTVYGLTCYGFNNTSVNATAPTITISAALTAPTMTLSASPTSITAGQSFTLSWSSIGATACHLPPNGEAPPPLVGPQGSVVFSPTQTTGYYVSCSDAGGASTSKTVTVTVIPATSGTLPVLFLTANNSKTTATVASGGQVTLGWSSTGATSCKLTGGTWNNSSVGLTDTKTLTLSATTTYTVTCTNTAGSTSKSITVTVSSGSTKQVLGVSTQQDIDPNAPASNCVSLSNNLRYRSRDATTNGDVSTLQDFLQSQGYLSTEPTGYFGLLTVSAVKNFQSANGITGDGFVGAFTRAKINTVSCGGTTSSSATPATTQPTPTPNTNTTTAYPGSATTAPTRPFYPPSTVSGCSSTFGFSTTTGQYCDGSHPPTPPPPKYEPEHSCSTAGLDTTTGFKCGCSSTSGWSTTTGQSCGNIPQVISFTVNPTTSYSRDTYPNAYDVSYTLANANSNSGVNVIVACHSGLSAQRLGDGGSGRPPDFGCGDHVGGDFAYGVETFTLSFSNSSSQTIMEDITLSAYGMNSVTRTISIPPTSSIFPPGCTSSNSFSSITGIACNTPLPAGCSSFDGWSSTTGQACNGTQ